MKYIYRLLEKVYSLPIFNYLKDVEALNTKLRNHVTVNGATFDLERANQIREQYLDSYPILREYMNNKEELKRPIKVENYPKLDVQLVYYMPKSNTIHIVQKDSQSHKFLLAYLTHELLGEL